MRIVHELDAAGATVMDVTVSPAGDREGRAVAQVEIAEDIGDDGAAFEPFWLEGDAGAIRAILIEAIEQIDRGAQTLLEHKEIKSAWKRWDLQKAMDESEEPDADAED